MNPKFMMGLAMFFAQTISVKSIAAIRKPEVKIAQAKPVIIAIIDTGADINHSQLKNNIWVNEGESGLDILGNDKGTNKIDDDDNGFVDDLHGWNFVDNSNRVNDTHGHGTHMAGIIKKEFLNRNNNNVITSSTSPTAVRFMILKYYDPKANQRDAIHYSTQAIKYANKMKANIINYSGGGYESSFKEFAEVLQSQKQGILFVAAAGNGQADTDLKKYYPASYGLNNIISVAAGNDDGDLVEFSNYGGRTVDIAAPGDAIFSTLPGNKFGSMSGTSQATAFVTGAAARIFAGHSTKKMKPQHVLNQLLKGARLNKTLAGKTKNQLALLNN